MRPKKVPISKIALCLILVPLAVIVEGEAKDTFLTMEQVMTPQELKQTGVSGLSDAQRRALEVWLNRYTQRVLEVSVHRATDEPRPAV